LAVALLPALLYGARMTLQPFSSAPERFQPGPLSWIHGLSALTLVMLPLGLLSARFGRIAAHRRIMISLFLGALVIAGVFTLASSRIIGQTIFGG
jgi:uncharacterized membrane protein